MFITSTVTAVLNVPHSPPPLQELAEVDGDQDRVGVLSTKIEEIEERAEELDKQRNKGLSAIRYV